MTSNNNRLNNFWLVTSSLALPCVTALGLIRPRIRRDLRDRLGLGSWKKIKSTFPSDAIWIHAASVGELTGVEPVVRLLRQDDPSRSLLLTTLSDTGKREATRRGLADAIAVLPFDHPLLLRRIIARIKPRLVLLAETELWPGFLFELERAKIPVILFNGRISDRALPRYRLLGNFTAHMLRTIHSIFVQSELDRTRLIELGASPERSKVGGSTKADVAGDVSGLPFERSNLGLSAGAPLLVAGSIREGEDEIVIDAFLRIRQSLPSVQLVIAPRHPEHFTRTAEHLSRRGIEFSRRSMQSTKQSAVLLLDSLGELSRVYALADLAFVGGTLVPIGGHSPLEPARAGIPVLVGPYTQNVRWAVDELCELGGLKVIRDSEELATQAVTIFTDELMHRRMSEGAATMFERSKGATLLVVETIRELLQTTSQPRLANKR